MSRVKSYIARVLKDNAINIFEIDENLVMFSTALKELLMPDFENYGVALEQFFVTNVVRPDGERQYERFKDLHFRQYADVAEAKLRQQTDIIHAQTEAQKTVIASQAMATKRAQEGYTYQQERGFDVSEQMAQNQAIGQFSNLGMGLGTMMGVGGAVGGMVGGTVKNAMSSVTDPGKAQLTKKCTQCGFQMPESAKFCFECGNPFETKPLKCPVCGADLVAGAKFCLECGNKL